MTDGATPDLIPRRQVLLGALAVGAGLVAAACAAPAAPSWTFGPPSRPKSAAGDGLVVRIVAENFAFDLAEFSVPADTPFQIEFDHRDVKIPHNVAIYDSGPEGPDLFRGEIFSGPDVVVYDVPGLPKGTHSFRCDPHPYMVGSVIVS